MKREGTLEDAIKDIEMVADDLFDMNQRSMATILRMTVPCIKDTAEWDKKLADRQMFTYLKDNETPPAYEDLLFRIQMKDSLGIQYHQIGRAHV